MVRGKLVDVVPPPNPSNINFENLEFTKFEKWKRRSLASLVSFVLILSSLFITTLIYSKTSDYNSIKNCELISSEAYRKIEEPTSAETNCFCSKLPLKQQLEGEFSNACKSYANQYIISLFIGFVASLILYIANFIIQKCQKLFSKFAKYHKYIEEYNSLMSKIFIPIFFNTVLLTPLIHTNFFGVRPGAVMLDTFSNGDQFESFSTLSFDWFMVVGAAVTTSMIVNVFTPLIGILKNPFVLWLKKKLARKFDNRRDIINYFKPGPFEFHYRYAYGLMSCGFCLIFEPILPYSTILCAGTLWMAYLSNKVSQQ